MTYQEWKDYAVEEYDLINQNYNHKVYEANVVDRETKEAGHVQLTLQDVMDACDHSVFEDAIRKAIMKCVYTNSSLNREVGRVMNLFYGVS